MVRKRRRHTAAFKFRVALEALESSKAIWQMFSEHEIDPNHIRSRTRRNRDPAGSLGRRI